MKEVLEAFKTNFPEHALKIKEVLQYLLAEVEFGMDNFKDDGFLLDELDNIHEELDMLIEKIDLGFGQMSFIEGISSIYKKDRPKHKDLQVDSTIPHILIENFTHIRPFGFRFQDGELNETKTWKELYVKACEQFLLINDKKFITFKYKTMMNGENRDYFSETSENINLPVKLSDNLYISTRFDANGFRDMLIKILKEYNYNVEDFKVYFKADYNPLHKY